MCDAAVMEPSNARGRWHPTCVTTHIRTPSTQARRQLHALDEDKGCGAHCYHRIFFWQVFVVHVCTLPILASLEYLSEATDVGEALRLDVCVLARPFLAAPTLRSGCDNDRSVASEWPLLVAPALHCARLPGHEQGERLRLVVALLQHSAVAVGVAFCGALAQGVERRGGG